MHMLMSSIGAEGIIMGNSGLELINSAFGGVPTKSSSLQNGCRSKSSFEMLYLPMMLDFVDLMLDLEQR